MNDEALAVHAVPHGARSGGPSRFVRVLRVAGAFLALEITMIALSVGWVAVHSYLVDPGHPPAHYEAYAQRAVPIFALTVSAPVFGAFGFLCGRRRGRSGAAFALLTTWVLVVLDVLFVLVATGFEGRAVLIAVAAAALKLAGTVAGGRLGARASEARA